MEMLKSKTTIIIIIMILGVACIGGMSSHLEVIQKDNIIFNIK